MAMAWLIVTFNVLFVLACGLFFHWPLLLGLVLACVAFVVSAGSIGRR
jgi:hypothetical protein